MVVVVVVVVVTTVAAGALSSVLKLECPRVTPSRIGNLAGINSGPAIWDAPSPGGAGTKTNDAPSHWTIV